MNKNIKIPVLHSGAFVDKAATNRMNPKLAIIVPCYNETEIIIDSAVKLKSELDTLIANSLVSEDSFVAFVDDGSRDDTWEKISNLTDEFSCLKGVRLQKNVGHQACLLAGIEWCSNDSDISISIDADLQQDPDAMAKFISEYRNGADIVCGVRFDRKGDTLAKKWTALLYTKLMLLMGVNYIKGHADYRLISRQVAQEYSASVGNTVFLRSQIASLGHPVIKVDYVVKEREKGISKYTKAKMFRLAFDGIVSQTTWPLRAYTVVGGVAVLASICLGIYAVFAKLTDQTLPGWASILFAVSFFSGIIMVGQGIIAEYILRTVKEMNKRDLFKIIDYR